MKVCQVNRSSGASYGGASGVCGAILVAGTPLRPDDDSSTPPAVYASEERWQSLPLSGHAPLDPLLHSLSASDAGFRNMSALPTIESVTSWSQLQIWCADNERPTPWILIDVTDIGSRFSEESLAARDCLVRFEGDGNGPFNVGVAVFEKGVLTAIMTDKEGPSIVQTDMEAGLGKGQLKWTKLLFDSAATAKEPMAAYKLAKGLVRGYPADRSGSGSVLLVRSRPRTTVVDSRRRTEALESMMSGAETVQSGAETVQSAAETVQVEKLAKSSAPSDNSWWSYKWEQLGISFEDLNTHSRFVEGASNALMPIRGNEDGTCEEDGPCSLASMEADKAYVVTSAAGKPQALIVMDQVLPYHQIKENHVTTEAELHSAVEMLRRTFISN